MKNDALMHREGLKGYFLNEHFHETVLIIKYYDNFTSILIYTLYTTSEEFCSAKPNGRFCTGFFRTSPNYDTAIMVKHSSSISCINSDGSSPGAASVCRSHNHRSHETQCRINVGPACATQADIKSS